MHNNLFINSFSQEFIMCLLNDFVKYISLGSKSYMLKKSVSPKSLTAKQTNTMHSFNEISISTYNVEGEEWIAKVAGGNQERFHKKNLKLKVI